MSQNPYQSTNFGNAPMTAAMADVDARTTFLKKTYLHLLGAILACVAIDAVILTLFGPQVEAWMKVYLSGWNSLIFLGAFMAVSYVADRWAHSGVSRQMQYLGLAVYVFAEALFLVPMLYYAQKYTGPGTIQAAGLVTGIVFGGLTVTVLFTKADFSFLRWGLTVGMFAAFALVGASIIMGGISLGLWFSIAMVVLASGIILYTTSNVLHRYNTDQYVAASLALFSAVALLFWYVLQIFISSD